MAIRFYLQPLMAAFLAVRDGRRDAAEGKSAYLWSLFAEPEHRRERLRHGWKSVGKVFMLAIVLDLVYSATVLRSLRPVQTIVVGAMLALLPYVLLRGPIDRLMSRRHAVHEPNPPMPNITQAPRSMTQRSQIPRIHERRTKNR